MAAGGSAVEASRQPHLGRPWDLFARGLGDFEALDASHLCALEALAGRSRPWTAAGGSGSGTGSPATPASRSCAVDGVWLA